MYSQNYRKFSRAIGLAALAIPLCGSLAEAPAQTRDLSPEALAFKEDEAAVIRMGVICIAMCSMFLANRALFAMRGIEIRLPKRK